VRVNHWFTGDYLTQFLHGILERNEVDAADGDRVYTRRLVVQTHAGSRVPIFDPHALSTPLALGERYDLVLKFGVARGMHLLSQPAPEPLPARADMLLRVFERAPDTLGFTQAQVLDAHWWIPDDLTPFVPEDAKARSWVLLQTPVGRMLAFHRSLMRRLGAVPTGTPFTWTRARLDLIAINGLPYPPPQHSVRYLWPSAEDLLLTEPRRLPPEVSKQLRQHQEWLDTAGTSGQLLNLRQADLRGLSLPGRQLRQSILFESLLSGSDLRKSDLTQAHLENSVLVGTRLDEALLEEADAAEAILRGASLLRVQADGIRLEDADLTGVNAQHARMAHAELAGANLEDSHFEDVDLRGSNLESAHLRGANLTGARLHGAFLEGADGIDTVHADWIDIGDEMGSQRLEGVAAQQWLHEAAQRKVRVADL
jgi:uncharacterized protein YjbI with pentapeptide repeats